VDTPWDRARKRRSELQEERLGQMPGGQKQVNSGRFWRWKRDGILWEFLIEARDTTSGSYSIKREEFLSIKREALATPPGLLAGMQIDIQDLSLVAIETKEFQGLCMRLAELEAEVESLKDAID
jgi:hypothetical protein